jgi:hypothetical protein
MQAPSGNNKLPVRNQKSADLNRFAEKGKPKNSRNQRRTRKTRVEAPLFYCFVVHPSQPNRIPRLAWRSVTPLSDRRRVQVKGADGSAEE